MEPADARLRLRSVARLARVLAEPRELLDLLELAGQEMRFALGAASVSLSRLERERGHVRTLVNVGDLAPWEERRPADETYSAVDLPMMVVLIEEVRSYTASIDDPRLEPSVRELLVDTGKGSGVAAPILLDGRVWGELWATRGVEETPFAEEDREVAEALAAVLAAGIGQSERFSQVERLIYEDPLTGLANRRAVDLALEQALDAHAVDGHPVSVVMGDVNGLKLANDLDGHEAGDRLIQACANAITNSLGLAPGALAGRIGGDEFCIVLDHYDAEVAESVGNEILRILAAGPYPNALAVGVSSTSIDGARAEPVTPRRLLRWADEAQYAAKRASSRHPIVAGRDVPLTEPVERRRRRRSPVPATTSAERAMASLDSSLRVLAEAGGQASPLDRLVLSLDAVADTVGAAGWIVATITNEVSRTVAFSASRDGLAVDAPLDLAESSWATAARSAGILAVAGDSSLPLADVRGCDTVAAAAAGQWWIEILADGPSALEAVPAVLRSVVCVAVAG